MGLDDFKKELGQLCERYAGSLSPAFPDELKEAMEKAFRTEMLPVFEMERIKRRENLNTREVSLLYGESEPTLRKMRVEGRGPRFIKRGASVLYRRTDLDEYYKARLVRTTDQPN
ncbi:helix-turn-helix domain-containing protein [Maridesulfovibrio sp. FT414]|uniref:helix-turn-helix domain-containing protein n=1 Tax=Maridesulfovibrio sp. FT414 TaxID=2979469 RepID=UPI003D80355C